MNKVLLLLATLSLTTVSTYALEPLILEPLGVGGYTRQATYSSTMPDTIAPIAEGEKTVSTRNYPSNMVPQNNAAKGLPAEKRVYDGINIETKQGSRTNTQWNPGGKGTKSYF